MLAPICCRLLLPASVVPIVITTTTNTNSLASVVAIVITTTTNTNTPVMS
jgi:hypothetical protein